MRPPEPGAGAAPQPARALRILHLTHQGDGAGSTVSISALAAAQQAAGHEVLVGCRPESLLAELARGDGREVVPLEFAHVGRLAGIVARVVRERGIDVVNAHASRDRAGCRRARLAGQLACALVMTRRQMPRSLPFSVIVNGFAADCTIAVSRPVARALHRRGAPPWRVRVVPNGVDLRRVDRPVSADQLDLARALIGWCPGRPTVGVVARLKDQAVLLRALAEVASPITLACVGVGPVPGLEVLADAVPRHRVALVPFQRDVLPFYHLFDIVVLPSREEGLSQAILEAMALGLPVITCRAGGNVDVISDGTDGLLVPPCNPGALAGALWQLLARPDLARHLGSAARRTARERFSMQRTRALTDDAYGVALGRRR